LLGEAGGVLGGERVANGLRSLEVEAADALGHLQVEVAAELDLVQPH